MKKLFLIPLCFILSLVTKAQQTITFSEYFDYYTGYCPGDPQYDNWVSFRQQLDTATEKLLSITMRGTYDMTGKTCSDKYVVRQIADALYNGYDLSVQCGNDVWTVGTGCSDGNCGDPSEYIELTTNQYTCNCGTSYTIRPAMTSPNWGGINTETCQWYYQNANQTMIADVLRLYQNNNLAVNGFVLPDECTNTQDLKVKIMNVGLSDVTGYYIGYSIDGITQTPVYVSNTITSEELQEVVFASAYVFTPGTSYDFKIWTYDPNGVTDDFTDNDEIKFTYTHTGSPATPTALDVVRCGRGSVTVNATSGASDSILWYSDATGGTLLKMGESYTTPYLKESLTIYAEANAFKSSVNTLTTTFHNYSMVTYDPGTFNGAMFDFNSNELVNIKGIKVQALFSNTNPFYRVYVKEGTHVNSESNPTEWTLVFNDYISASGDNMNTIPVNFTPKPGVSYGVYITTDPVSGEDIWINYGNTSYSTPEITMSGGKMIVGLFGTRGVYSNYMLDAEIIYSTACVSPSRQPVQITVNPKPSGSELTKGNDYKGLFKLGIPSQPDVVEVDKRLEYELTPPTNYTNADYGTTWDINSVEITDESNTPINNSMYSFVNPTASNNGLLTFIADNSVLDQTVLVKVNYKDLGPYYCDTTVIRAIHIAPTPKPDFTFPSIICDGDEILFDNKSSIFAGNLSYMWYFGDNDSSDSQQPVHVYNAKGPYTVRLVAKSSPWGIESDTSFSLVINEVPKAKFKVLNSCEGGNNTFTNLTTISTGTITYDWDFGDNSLHSTAKDPQHMYNVPQSYLVTLKASSNGCVSELVRSAYLFATPVADFVAPAAPVCAETQFVMPNSSTIAQGYMGSFWDYSDGTISTEYQGVHKYPTQGLYNVKLKMVSEFGCENSITKQVTIKPTPVIDFAVDRLCSLDPSNFTNLSTEYPATISVYSWEFSDGENFTTKNVKKQWDLIGSKTVKLKSTMSNGCEAELTKNFDVLVQPVADFTYSDVCSGQDAFFYNKSYASQGDINYSWNFGDLSPNSTMPNPSHVYNVPSSSTFTVELLTKVVGGCDDTVRKVLNVTETPICDFKFESYFISGNRGYKFTPLNGTYSSYEWYFGEGGYSLQKTPVYQYASNGNYDVTLIAKNSGGCECRGTKNLSVIPSSVDNISNGAINVYPNPASSNVTIEVTELMKGATYTIYNAIGQIVDNGTLDNNNTALNTEDYTEGVYMVHVTKDGKTFTAKVVVKH
ncbi:MAG: PKD domain-containing protein [Bacteroidota bacterium]